MVAVTLEGIRKSFGTLEVLKGISLVIPDQAFVAFVGPSGCGKSTLLRVIAGLEQVNEGELRFGDRRMNEVAAPDRGAAMVFQSYALYPHMTVWENMSFSQRLKGMGRAERRQAAAAVAETLQLGDYLDRKPSQLSGGQRQRVAIGRALMRAPDVFLFDEPLSNLDAALRAEMRVELTRLHQAVGNTMIYVTHDQIEAMTMADQIVVLNEGCVMQVGTPMELYERPQSRFVAEFIGAPKINLLNGLVVATEAPETQLRLTNGTMIGLPPHAIPAGSTAEIGIRPEHIDLEARADSAADGALEVTVDVVQRLGADALIYCRAEGIDGAIRVRTEGVTRLISGDRVALSLDRHHCHLFDRDGERIAEI